MDADRRQALTVAASKVKAWNLAMPACCKATYCQLSVAALHAQFVWLKGTVSICCYCTVLQPTILCMPSIPYTDTTIVLPKALAPFLNPCK